MVRESKNGDLTGNFGSQFLIPRIDFPLIKHSRIANDQTHKEAHGTSD
jgi:hypothetical protein